MLSRKIALPPAPTKQTASALPLYLQRTPALPSTAPSRPRSPQLVQSRPGTPPSQRPNSPFRGRSIAGSSLTGTPVSVPIVSPAPGTSVASDIGVDIVILDIPRDSITIEKLFTVSVRLTVSAPPLGKNDKASGFRIISLAVQHIQVPRAITSAQTLPASISDALNPPILMPGHSSLSLSPTGSQWPGAAFNSDVEHDKLATASHGTKHGNDDAGSNIGDIVLPPPFVEQVTERKPGASPDVTFIGPSVVFLSPIHLSAPEQSEGHDNGNATTASEAVEHFDLSFLPLRTGLLMLGGLRVLLIEDKMVDENETQRDADEGSGERTNPRKEAQILREWEVLGEIWVKM
jgi:trafficking protein particle complex subunit 13